jgi:hypothetical protein
MALCGDGDQESAHANACGLTDGQGHQEPFRCSWRHPEHTFVRFLLCRLRAVARELLPGAIFPQERVRAQDGPRVVLRLDQRVVRLL